MSYRNAYYMNESTGYMHPTYAFSLHEFGKPRKLAQCGGWILEREIPGTPYRDAMGCYPLFTCKDWSKLVYDMEGIKGDFITISVVTDPFGQYDKEYLNMCFKDIVFPFKEHFIVDLGLPLDSYMSKHHRRYARKALEKIEVQKCSNPFAFIDDWNSLYKKLIKKHDIKGIRAFSKECFDWQLNVPGIVVFRATSEGETVGMLLWYTQDERAYYHLGAFTETGYAHKASFALFIYAIEDFRKQGLEWLDLGAGAGVRSSNSDGLSQFKRGWSTGTRTAYFCGGILQNQKYTTICQEKNIGNSNYFPAYREGEFY